MTSEMVLAAEFGRRMLRFMTPEAALNEQIKRYRKMTGEQRLKIALDLHELACDVARAGIRHQHPEADEGEVEELLRKRLSVLHQS